MKRLSALMLALTMVLSSVVFSAASDLPFTDVKESDYYYDAVDWAFNTTPQVTDGTSATTFSPNRTCTRGQVVTFLWRAAGEPEPSSSENPFADVKESDYFFKPVLWAVEKGITDGTSPTTFSPKNTCRNSHILTFIYRAVGEPNKTGAGTWWQDAYNWADSAGLLTGTYSGSYDINSDCPRANVVEYLYRYASPAESGAPEEKPETPKDPEVPEAPKDPELPKEPEAPETVEKPVDKLTIVKEPLDVEFIDLSTVLSITVSGEFDSIVYEWQKEVSGGWRDVATLNSDDAIYTVNNSALHIISKNGTEGFGSYRCIVSAFNGGDLVARVTSRTAMVDPQAAPMKALLALGDSAGRKYYYFYHTGHDSGEIDPDYGGELYEETTARIFRTYSTQERFEEATEWIVGEPIYDGPPVEEAIVGFWIREGRLAGGPYGDGFQDQKGAFFKNENGEYVTNEILLNHNYFNCSIASVSGGKGPYTYTWYISKDRFGNDFQPLIEGYNCIGQGTENIWVWPFEPGKGMGEPYFMGFLCCRVTDSKGRTTNACYYMYPWGTASGYPGHMHNYQMLYALNENSPWFKNADDCIENKHQNHDSGENSALKCVMWTYSNQRGNFNKGLGRWW